MTRQYDASNTVDYHLTMEAHPQQTMFRRGWSLAADAFTSAFKAVVRWNERHAQRRHLQELPDYMLKDMGIRRDQIDAIISGNLRRDPLALSPTGGQSAPAFRNAQARAQKSANSNTGERLAA